MWEARFSARLIGFTSGRYQGVEPRCEADPVWYSSSDLIHDVEVASVSSVGLPGDSLVDESVLQPGLLAGAGHHGRFLVEDLRPVEVPRDKLITLLYLTLLLGWWVYLAVPVAAWHDGMVSMSFTCVTWWLAYIVHWIMIQNQIQLLMSRRGWNKVYNSFRIK